MDGNAFGSIVHVTGGDQQGRPPPPGNAIDLEGLDLDEDLFAASSSSSYAPHEASKVPQVPPEFPRHKLRVVEKLGEGGFGMVSRVI